jgi:hypothetical protein
VVEVVDGRPRGGRIALEQHASGNRGGRGLHPAAQHPAAAQALQRCGRFHVNWLVRTVRREACDLGNKGDILLAQRTIALLHSVDPRDEFVDEALQVSH